MKSLIIITRLPIKQIAIVGYIQAESLKKNNGNKLF